MTKLHTLELDDDHPMYDPDYDGKHELFRKLLTKSFIKEELAVMNHDKDTQYTPTEDFCVITAMPKKVSN